MVNKHDESENFHKVSYKYTRTQPSATEETFASPGCRLHARSGETSSGQRPRRPRKPLQKSRSQVVRTTSETMAEKSGEEGEESLGELFREATQLWAALDRLPSQSAEFKVVPLPLGSRVVPFLAKKWN